MINPQLQKALNEQVVNELSASYSYLSISAALAGLFILGVGKGRLVQRSPFLQGMEILVLGAISAGVGFGLGDLIPRLIEVN